MRALHVATIGLLIRGMKHARSPFKAAKHAISSVCCPPSDDDPLISYRRLLGCMRRFEEPELGQPAIQASRIEFSFSRPCIIRITATSHYTVIYNSYVFNSAALKGLDLGSCHDE